ncbi:MAG: Gfo/Idh/MocA family protein [Chitinophagales bacterium]
MRLGIVGLRHFHAHELVQGLRSQPGVELIGIAEDDDAVFASEGQRYGAPRFTDWRVMLDQEKPDIVGVVNVPGLRGKVIAECLRRGISVLADKPLCVTFAELEEIRAALAASPATLFLLLTERYNPPTYTLKRLVDEGKLGRVFSFTSFRPHKLMRAMRPGWFWHRETYGGIIVDLTVHDVDVFHWVTGLKGEEIYASHTNLTCPEAVNFEDAGHFFLKAEGGVTGLFRTDWLTPDGELTHGDCRYFVAGTLGHAEVRTTGGFPGQTGGGLRLVTNAAPPTEVALLEPEHTIYEDFLAAVNGAKPAISAEEILHATELTLRARESADAGRPIRLG